MKQLIAAISEVRAKLARVEDLLERGEDEKALVEIAAAEDAWAAAMNALRRT